jgi:hypothetical protein
MQWRAVMLGSVLFVASCDFVSVPSGAVLTFEVQAYSSGTFVLELTLSAEPGKPLDHGKVLMVGKRCPIPV